jgi:hypothetical protein
MYRKAFQRYVLFAVVFVFITGVAASVRGQTEQNEDKTAAEQKKASEDALVQASRDAILSVGISAEYFEEHFKLFKVFDSTSDRRVLWRFSVNEYETTVQDSVGVSTVGAERHLTHTVSSLLNSMIEIHKTIPRRQAEKMLTACIGKHETPSVELRLDEKGKIGLFLAASAVPAPDPVVANFPATTTPGKPEIVPTTQQERDSIRERGKRRDPLVLGAVNLQTGKCIKGLGLVGPRPSKSK